LHLSLSLLSYFVALIRSVAFLVIPIFPRAGTIKRPLYRLETRLIAKRARECCEGGCKALAPTWIFMEMEEIKRNLLRGILCNNLLFLERMHWVIIWHFSITKYLFYDSFQIQICLNIKNQFFNSSVVDIWLSVYISIFKKYSIFQISIFKKYCMIIVWLGNWFFYFEYFNSEFILAKLIKKSIEMKGNPIKSQLHFITLRETKNIFAFLTKIYRHGAWRNSFKTIQNSHIFFRKLFFLFLIILSITNFRHITRRRKQCEK